MTHQNLANNIPKEDSRPECPLCMESLELDDINFYPCECGYQVCRFCWHRIRTDENGLCPACRKAYSENPAEYTPLSQEQLQKMKEVKKQRSVEKRHKVIESRKSLTNVRVVQKNLVFVIGLSPRLADPETLKKQEYFGKFGKIYRVVINSSTIYTGSQGNSLGAYITFYRSEDATKAIQAVNNAYIDGRCLKASLGTTKYCSHFLAGLTCPKSDCLFLHELGEEEASFTKEDMQLGKHQTYESITLAQAANTVVTKEQDKQPKKPPLVSQKSKEFDTGFDTAQLPSESALPATAHWASQNNRIPEVSKPITTQTSNTTALPAANEKHDINSSTFDSSTSNSSISSSRETNGVIEDLSSLNIHSSSESSVINAPASNSELTGNTQRTSPGKHRDENAALHKCPSDDGDRGISDTVALERHRNDDSNNLTTKCPHQQQSRSKENVTVAHKGPHQQAKSGGKGSKKSKDKKNTNTSHEKLKQTGGTGARNVSIGDSTTSNPAVKVENSTTKSAKENVTKAGGSHGNVRDSHNKKRKNKDNVLPTGGAVPHEELALAKSDSNFVVEQRSSSTGVKAPPPGLTKQPSHTNAVNVLSQLAGNQSGNSYWPDLSKLHSEDDDELGFDPWSVSSKGFEDILPPPSSQSANVQKSLVGMTNSKSHTLPAANSVLYDAQRQAAAAYANYGPTAEDQLHQLQYHGKHPVQFNHPATSNTMENQLRALLPGINISFDAATTHYQSAQHHPRVNYPSSSYYPPALAKQPMMVRPPAAPIQSSALASHRNVQPLAVTTTSYNSKHVIASPFDIPSLGGVTTTAQSSWPDLMSSSYDMNNSTNSSSSVNNSSGASGRATRSVSSLPAHQPPLVFPSNPEPFRDYGGLNFSSLTSSTTGIKKTDTQTNSEHNKGEYSLWSDTNSFSTDYNFFSSHATEYHQNIIKEMHGTKEDAQKGSSSWKDLCSNGDCSIPPTGLEFHNTRLLPGPGRQQPAAPVSPHVPQNLREQEAVIKPRQKEMNNNNPVGSIGSLPQYTSSVIGAQGSHNKRPPYGGNVSNSTTHYYTGPHYSQLAAAAASSNYNRNSRYPYYQQHHT